MIDGFKKIEGRKYSSKCDGKLDNYKWELNNKK